MKEHLKVFLALAAIIGGIVCILAFIVVLFTAFGYAADYAAWGVIGVLLMAGGLTYFWMKRRPPAL